MRLLRALAVASAVVAWLVILVGGFTTATNSGAGCREAILCGETPYGPGAALIEGTHRVVAWTEGFLVLSMFVLVLWRYRAWRPVRNLTVLSFALVVVQGALGMLSVAATYDDLGLGPVYPAFVTAHLGVATAFLAVCVLNASLVLWARPPPSVTSPRPSGAADAA